MVFFFLNSVYLGFPLVIIMGPTRYGDDVFGYVARPILKAIDIPVLYVLDLLRMEDKVIVFV